ncbi:MAG TPA: serpin family protein [Bryobacteraceae bacterium]|nr:serpin family protein [Bryobacteraceae bacterium]
MTENGAAGQTPSEMRRTLEIPPELSEDAFQQAAAALSRSLRSREGGELAIANALWANRGFRLAESFVRRSREYYDAQASTLDVERPEATETINAWVSKYTQGKIPGIVTQENVRSSLAILTNAVYFRGCGVSGFPKTSLRTMSSTEQMAAAGPSDDAPGANRERLPTRQGL